MSTPSSSLHVIALAILPALLLSCGDPPGEEGDDDSSVGSDLYPLDDEFQIHHLQAKATHNSYHLAPPYDDVTAWNYSHLPLDEQAQTQGVRGFELDFWYREEEGDFEVYHVPLLDEVTTCRAFTDCLAVLKGWSDQNPSHHPLLMQLEPKDAFSDGIPAGYFDDLEEAILSVWPEERIVTPDEVQGDAESLKEALTARGWPTLGESRGRILFYLDNTSEIRDAYSLGGTSLQGRLIFVDGSPDDAASSVLVRNDPVGDADEINELVEAGYLVRTRADSDSVEALAGDITTRDAALASGAHIVSTDYPAPVEGLTYFVEVPGGTPSRCNPLSAPAACTSQAVEDLGL